MKKVKYPRIILEAGVTEKELVQFEYTEPDIKRLADIIQCEKYFSTSPQIAHHLKKASDTTGQNFKFSQVNELEAAILSEFESGKARFYATLRILVVREKLYNKDSIILASAAVQAGTTANSIEQDLVILNLARSIMVKYLSIQSNLLVESGEDHTHHALYTALLLNNLAEINCKVGNMPLALELYKQAWLLGNKFFISIEHPPFMNNIKGILDKHVEGFTSDPNSTCSYIVERGIDREDNIILLAKSEIQKPILDNCVDLIESEKWDSTPVSYGLGSYITPKNIRTVLEKSLTEVSNDTLEEAQMLCFQQICVITQKIKSTTCLDKFVDTYPEIALKILIKHPEYCIDGWIFHQVSKKLFESDSGLEDVPILVTTIDILLGESAVKSEERKDSHDGDVEAIGNIFSEATDFGS